MSRHMLFSLKVKHPSGLRLHHFFNRWDAPTICIVFLLFFFSSDLSVFRLSNALKDLKQSNSSSAGLKLHEGRSEIRAPQFKQSEWKVIKLTKCPCY